MASAFKNKEINWWKIIFVIFTAAYASLILIKPSLGISNDIMFLRTLQAGKPILLYSPSFPDFDPIKMGRFTPMGTIEYNLFGFFSKSPSAFWYFLLHAFQYVVFMFLLAKILSKFTSNKFLTHITPVLLSLTPGMIVTWFPTLGNEKSLIFYFTIFLFCYLKYLEKSKLYYLIIGVISANIAIYCKENAFLALAALTSCHLLFSRKSGAEDKSLPSSNNDDPRTKSPIFSNKAGIFDGLVILSSISFPIVYFFLVFLPYRAALVYGKTTANFVAIIKNILNFAFIVDPIMILFILPLIGWRIYRIFIKRERPHIIYDSLLAMVPVYIAPFFIINLYEFHYFAPMYIFTIPALFYFVPQVWNKKIIWKILALTAGFLFIFDTLPFSLHFLTYAKYLPNNFNKTLDFVIKDIKSKPDKRANIFLAETEICGANQAWAYFKFSEFLLYKGLTAEQFDLKSNQKKTPDCDSSIHDTKVSLDRFTVFQYGPASKIAKGDYLIVTPEITDEIKNNSNKDYLESLNNEHDLVFRTRSAFAFPMLNLNEIIRYFLSVAASPGQKLFGVSQKRPFMRWPDFYVFIHK